MDRHTPMMLDPQVLVNGALKKWNENYSTVQRRMLIALPMVSGSLSVLGSSLILFMLYKRGSLKRLPDRIFIMMSSVDIVESMWNIFGIFAVPSETGAPFAKGTWATCEASGFFTNFAYTVGLYNCSFLLYVLLRLRYHVPERVQAKSIEKYMHAIAFLFPLVTGTLALVYNAYNPVGVGFRRCYVVPYPPRCQVIPGAECTRGGDINIQAVFTFIPNCLLMVSFFTVLIMIYMTARKTYQQSSSHRMTPMTNSQIMAQQSILFGVFFINTFIWNVLLPIAFNVKVALGRKNPSPPYWMNCCFELFWPLQGFCNFIIFSRLRFFSIRKARNDKSIFWALKETIVGEELTSSRYRRRQQPARPVVVVDNPNQDSVDKSSSNSGITIPAGNNGHFTRRHQNCLPNSEGACSIADYDDCDITSPFVRQNSTTTQITNDPSLPHSMPRISDTNDDDDDDNDESNVFHSTVQDEDNGAHVGSVSVSSSSQSEPINETMEEGSVQLFLSNHSPTVDDDDDRSCSTVYA